MKLSRWLRHLFVPHHSNNHKARILHPASLTIIVALFLVGQFALNYYTLISPSVLGFASNITPEKVVELTNQKRAERGLGPLKTNSLLNEVAQRKAGDMFAFNYWAHTSPSGRDPWSFFQEVGYKYTYAGENLARDFMNSESVVEAWMNSPSHRDNLLNPNYKEIGLAVVNGTLNGVETTLVVQSFGTPTPAAPSTVPQAVLKKPSLGEAAMAANQPETVLTGASGSAMTTPSILSPFLLTKTISVFLLGLIFGALLIDAVFVWRKRIVRLSGKNIAHLVFIGALLLAAIITKQGVIL